MGSGEKGKGEREKGKGEGERKNTASSALLLRSPPGRG